MSLQSRYSSRYRCRAALVVVDVKRGRVLIGVVLTPLLLQRIFTTQVLPLLPTAYDYVPIGSLFRCFSHTNCWLHGKESQTSKRGGGGGREQATQQVCPGPVFFFLVHGLPATTTQ